MLRLVALLFADITPDRRDLHKGTYTKGLTQRDTNLGLQSEGTQPILAGKERWQEQKVVGHFRQWWGTQVR